MGEVIFILVLPALIILAFAYLVYLIMHGAEDFKEDIEFNPGEVKDHANDNSAD